MESPSAKKGLIAQAAETFPAELLIPVIPPSAKGFDPQQAGKAPGFWTGESWRLLDKWRLGCNQAVRNLSDEKRANVGLILGLPQRGVQYVALDIDTATDDNDPKSIKTLAACEVAGRVINSLQTQLKQPLWVRETKPGRAAILFRIAADQSPGTKRVYMLEHPDERFHDLGKLEILSSGQQMCIAGTHQVTRKAIQWYRTDLPDVKVPLPTSNEDIYEFASRNMFDTAIGIVLANLEKAQVTVSHSRHKSVSDKTDSIVSPEEQAPPSALRLIQLLERLPHTSAVDRDAYVGTMHAVVGCLRALEKLKRITAEEKLAVRHAAIEWAARWENPYGDGTTYEAEESKWDKDWSRTGSIVAGWQSLLNTGISLGLEDLRLEEARDVFAAFELDEAEEPKPEFKPIISSPIPHIEPKPENFYEPNSANGYIPEDALSDPYRPRKAAPGTLDVKESDIQIADALEKITRGRALYFEAEKRWRVWQGARYAWGLPYGERIMRTYIEDGLKMYVSHHFPLLEGPNKAKYLSGSRIDTMERMLRVRLGEQSPGSNMHIIQCPDGAYNLETGQKLSVDDQKKLRECRSTAWSPKDVPTPLFDAIISLVCSHDPKTTEWLYHYLGYLMLGDPKAQQMLIIHGPGGNGKGALGRAVSKAMGTYAIEAAPDLLVESAKNRHKTSLYDLKGKRYWFVSEISAAESWNEQQIKSLTGGDRIYANKMYHDGEYFIPEGSFVISTNTLPSLHKVDDAIVRRLRIIGAKLKPEKKDPTLEYRLEKSGELSGVLFKLMKYATKVYQNNFELPEVPEYMNKETSRYFEDQDAFSAWWRSEIDSTGLHVGSITVKDLKTRFESWLKRRKHIDEDADVFGVIDTLTQPQFLAEIRRQGATVELYGNDLHVAGIRFRIGSVKAVA